MRNVKRLIAISLAGIFWTMSPACVGQEVQKIAAIVNDDVISLYDVEQRVRLTLISTGVRDTLENRHRLKGQVLRSLIDESVQLQEAKRLNVAVGKTDVDRAFLTVARQNKMTSEEFEAVLLRNSIDKQTLLSQLEAEIAWGRLVSRRLRPNLQIGQEEIDSVLQRLQSATGKTQVRLAEIFLPVETPGDADRVRKVAERLIDHLHNGAVFSNLAREFSQGATAAVGGDLGWVLESDLETAIGSAVAKLAKGQVSNPIRTPAGYYLVALISRQVLKGADPLEAEVALKQLVVAPDADGGDTAVQQARDLAADLRAKATDCDTIAALSKETGSDASGDLGTLKIADLPPVFQAAVRDLTVNQVSEPIKTDQGWHLLMVCSRKDPPSGLPSRDQVSESLKRERLSMLARRYLRDLKRDSVVEFR